MMRKVLVLFLFRALEMRTGKRRVGDDGKPGLADESESGQGFHRQPD
jgi:hypothetical protein